MQVIYIKDAINRLIALISFSMLLYQTETLGFSVAPYIKSIPILLIIFLFVIGSGIALDSYKGEINITQETIKKDSKNFNILTALFALIGVSILLFNQKIIVEVIVFTSVSILFIQFLRMVNTIEGKETRIKAFNAYSHLIALVLMPFVILG